MTKEEIGGAIESAMRRRTKAKQIIACAEEKLEAIQKSLDSLKGVNLLDNKSLDLSQVDKGRLRFSYSGYKVGVGLINWISVDWPDLSEISRLVTDLEEAQKDLSQADQRLADLGTPI